MGYWKWPQQAAHQINRKADVHAPIANANDRIAGRRYDFVVSKLPPSEYRIARSASSDEEEPYLPAFFAFTVNAQMRTSICH